MYLIPTLAFNTAIAGLLTMLGVAPFQVNFIYSQCIGLSVMTINTPLAYMLHSATLRFAVLAISLPASVAVGMGLAFLFSGVGGWDDEKTWVTMLIGLFFGLIGAITVLLSRQIELEARQRHFMQAENEKREVEATLKLLQAQIEPHFLFNTLANVSSLIDTDPPLAKRLLERLNDWLRIALVRTRSEHSTLGDELEMLENYLQILRVRFGERLHWRIDAAAAAEAILFPPMLLQPLVENAVRHGIEPKIGGGEIRIVAALENGRLRVEVSDDGNGLHDDGVSGKGTGLANVRARLATLFGDEGRFVLNGNGGGGVTAILEVPA